MSFSGASFIASDENHPLEAAWMSSHLALRANRERLKGLESFSFIASDENHPLEAAWMSSHLALRANREHSAIVGKLI